VHLSVVKPVKFQVTDKR